MWEPHQDGSYPGCKRSVYGGIANHSGKKSYVCRVIIDGEVLPGKFMPKNKGCYVARNGQEEKYYTYQVLRQFRGTKFAWKQAIGGKVPTGAVQGGITRHGEP